MMQFADICLWIILAILCVLCFSSCIKPANFPPGPPWVPFLGCLLTFQKLLRKNDFMHEVLQELSQTYGPLMGLKLGQQKFIVVMSHDLVKKALMMEEFNGRPDSFFFKLRSFGKRKGVLFTDGPKWSQHRKFTLRHLRNFGFGQALMKEHLRDEAKYLVLRIKKVNANAPVLMHSFFDLPVLNVLWTMFAGHRFDYEDKKVTDILNVVHEAFRLMDCMGGLMSHIPFLRFICPNLCGYNRLVAILKCLVDFLDEEVQIHEQQLNRDSPRDLIDAFLLEMHDRKPSEESIFDREELLMLCMDLFMAGSETTSSTLSNIFLYLALHPHWLKILQKDLDDAIGRHRPPMITDLTALPRIEAFIAEAQRLLLLAPLGIPHRALNDVNLNGYNIPKGTPVLFSYHSAVHDKAYWNKPEEFCPNRFLDKNGNFKSSNISMSFGLGKRRCLGEVLARGSLFLFLTTIIHYYDFHLSPEHEIPDMKGYDGFTIAPKPYYLVYKLREDVTL